MISSVIPSHDIGGLGWTVVGASVGMVTSGLLAQATTIPGSVNWAMVALGAIGLASQYFRVRQQERQQDREDAKKVEQYEAKFAAARLESEQKLAAANARIADLEEASHARVEKVNAEFSALKAAHLATLGEVASLKQLVAILESHSGSVEGRVEAIFDKLEAAGEIKRPVNGARPPLDVLLVEDNKATAHQLARLLTWKNFRVYHAATVDEAIGRLRERAFDSVILDMVLPGGGGPEVLRMIRYRNMIVPVIVTTGNPGLVETAEMQSLRPDRVFTKPVPFDELIEALQPARAEKAVGSGAS